MLLHPKYRREWQLRLSQFAKPQRNQPIVLAGLKLFGRVPHQILRGF